ncbi:sugar ABC transporter permease [Nakamurella silvestris]|nr:sugar ABC transporter permease [Nakamurella silvestris]
MDWLFSPVTAGDKILSMIAAIVIFVVVMGAILLAVGNEKAPSWLVAAGFLGPVVIFLAVGLVWPTLQTIWKSFQTTANVIGPDNQPVRNPDFSIQKTTSFNFNNYKSIFTDSDLLRVLGNTLLWTILVPLVATAIGLVYAVIIDRSRFEKFAKTLIFIPMAISMVGAAIIWRFVYAINDAPGANQIGIANQFLVWIGLKPINFLNGGLATTFFLIIVMIWIQAGFAMTILSAAIKAIPEDTIEAAKIDGASGMKLFTRITIPSIRSALVVVLTTLAIGALKAYDIVKAMGNSNPTVDVIATRFITYFNSAETENLSSALAVVLFVMVLPIVVYNVRQMRKQEETR